MRVLVTGAGGFIGKWVVRALADAGHETVAAVRRADSAPAEAAMVRVGDLLEPDARRRALEGCEAVCHLAARVSFDPRERANLMRANAELTERLLADARESGVGRIVVASSAITMGVARDRADIRDESRTATDEERRANPYMDSKLACEAVCRRAAEAGQDVVIVNPTTVYGPGDDTLNSGTLVAKVATGGVVPVPAGGANVVDVRDVAQGFLAALEKGHSGKRYLLTGENRTFRSIMEAIAEAVGRRPRLVPLPRAARLPMMVAAWGVQRLTGSRLITPQIIGDTFAWKFYDASRAADELGWRATTPFDATLHDAWAYYRANDLIPHGENAS